MRLWGSIVGALASFAFVAPAPAQSLPVEAPGRSGHAELSLHARDVRSETRAEQVAWVALTLPLDTLAAPPRELPVVPHPSAAPVVTSPPAVTTEPQSLPGVTLAQLRALTDFIRRAIAVASSVAGASSERGRVDSLGARARSSALLPELRLRAVRNSDRALRWLPTTDDPYRVSQADGTGVLLEASATFRLDRLLFANEELRVEQLRLEAAEQRLKLEARVRAVVLELFRVREQICQKDAELERSAERTLELFKLLAELDDLTGSWFSQGAPSTSRAIWGFPEAIFGVCAPPAKAPAPSATIPVASLADSG